MSETKKNLSSALSGSYTPPKIAKIQSNTSAKIAKNNNQLSKNALISVLKNK
jgi:hypothetical protein